MAESKHQNTLKLPRRLSKVVGPEKIIIDAAAKLAERLNKEIERGNDTAAFTIAIIFAASKDGLDIVLGAALFGLIPFFGQIPGLFITAFLTFFLWGKGWLLRTRIKVIWWVAGFFIDNLPAVNLLPIETIAVLYAWHNVRERKNIAEEKLKNLKSLTMEEINNLNNNIELLDET